jgi:hypothetical protein
MIAGRDLPSDTFLFWNPSVFAPNNWTDNTMLGHYTFSSTDKEVALVLLGPESLLNHAPDQLSNTKHFWDSDTGPIPEKYPEYRVGNVKGLAITTKNISKGGQIFTHYGEEWFAGHGMIPIDLTADEVNAEIPSNENDKKVCLSGAEVNYSRLPKADFGLFANRTFRQDELILVAPTLLLSMEKLYASLNVSVILNYCWYKPNSAVGLLPLGYSSLLNHFESFTPQSEALCSAPNGDCELIQETQRPNIYIKWFNWETGLPEDFPSIAREKNLTELLRMSFAPVDLGFYASREIGAGEELTIDYGSEWANTYEPTAEEPPTTPFRHWIGGIDHLFPDDWINTDKNEICERTNNHPLFCFP